MAQSLVEQVRDRVATLHASIGQILDLAAQEERGFKASEQRQYDKLVADKATMTERLHQLEASEKAAAATAEVRRMVGGSGNPNGLMSGYTSAQGGNSNYFPAAGTQSYFRDLVGARQGDADAADRLRMNNMETRTSNGLGSYTAGGGADMAVPGYFDIVERARATAVTASLVHQQPLEPGISSVNLPRITGAGGTSVGVQTGQNTAVTNVDAVEDLLTSPITTVAGVQLASLQLLNQSPYQVDQVLLNDLASDYGRVLGSQYLTGSGTGGYLAGYVTKAVADAVQNQPWTIASPTVPKFFAFLGYLSSLIATARFRSADTIVLHPRRWAWLSSAVDSSGRPYVNAEGTAGSGSLANLAVQTDVSAAGKVGRIAGVDVFVDPSIPVNLGTGGNQDVALMFVREDPWLWQSPIVAEALEQPYAANMSVLLRVYSYSASIPNRQPNGNGLVYGTVGTGSTGLVTPTFSYT
jgi:HK97 family phage major capsid protein